MKHDDLHIEEPSMLTNAIASKAHDHEPATSPITAGEMLLRIKSLELALDSLGQALVVLDAGRIVYATPHASRILSEEDGLKRAGDLFQASLEEDQKRLTAALAKLFPKAEAEALTKLEERIRRPSGKRPYKLHINALHNGSQALVIILDNHSNYMAWHDRLQAKFRLTPRECEVAMLLTDGYSMSEIADRMSISMQTLRQHLKHAFNKTDTHKQHELVGIVLQMRRKR